MVVEDKVLGVVLLVLVDLEEDKLLVLGVVLLVLGVVLMVLIDLEENKLLVLGVVLLVLEQRFFWLVEYMV